MNMTGDFVRELAVPVVDVLGWFAVVILGFSMIRMIGGRW